MSRIENMGFSGSANILITNNPQVKEHFQDRLPVEYLETPLIDILIRVRDHLHNGHRLLTHPLSGSVKPNETPYKTVLISGTRGETDPQSISIIEECIIATHKFTKKHIPERYLQDLQAVDLSLIGSALQSGTLN